MRFILATLFGLLPALAYAEAPVVQKVDAVQSGSEWNFSVTLAHPDTGWQHYADGWEVLSPDGESLGLRVLAHPHVTEQPFTRSLGGVAIPATMEFVNIRARCLVDGWSETLFRVDLN